MERLIALSSPFGVMPASRARSFSKGYGLSLLRSGFTAPALLPVLGNDARVNPAAYVEARLELQVARLERAHQVVEDAVGHGLVERAFVAIRPNIKLERFQLHAQAIGNVVEHQRGEIRLTGHRAEAGERRDLHVDPVVALRRRIDESF